jgi:DHA1 family inner membrane transport protein
LGAFAVGTSEFMISGLLREVSADLGVSVPETGLLVTGYALGVAMGGPLMTVLTGRLERRTQLVLLLAIFILGNLVCALAPSYGPLLAGRVLASFCHGAYYGACSVAAGSLVPAGQKARALALVSAGVMVANVIGVPAGAALGQAVGWRAAFWAVSVLGATAGLSLLVLLPAKMSTDRFRIRAEIVALGRPQVLLGLALSLCFTVGLFSCFPYLTPLLITASGAQPQQIPFLLAAFGIGATIGVLGGGRLADWRLKSALAIAFCAQGAAYLSLMMLSTNLTAMWVVMLAVGIAGMSAVAPLRLFVLNGAHDAPALAATMTSSAFNLGVAMGAALGAILLQSGLGYSQLPGLGVACAAVGLALLPCVRGRSSSSDT